MKRSPAFRDELDRFARQLPRRFDTGTGSLDALVQGGPPTGDALVWEAKPSEAFTELIEQIPCMLAHLEAAPVTLLAVPTSLIQPFANAGAALASGIDGTRVGQVCIPTREAGVRQNVKVSVLEAMRRSGSLPAVLRLRGREASVRS